MNDTDKIDFNVKGHRFNIGKECKTNPKFYDDKLPGIIVKIDGRIVSRKKFLKFINENKEDFVRAYNEAYAAKIQEKEQAARENGGKENQQEKMKDRDDTKTDRKPPEFKDVRDGDYKRGLDIIKDTLGKYSDIPWKNSDIVMENGDRIHIERQKSEDQKLSLNRADFTINGKAMTEKDFSIAARYIDLHEAEFRTKVTTNLDKVRANIARRNEDKGR